MPYQKRRRRNDRYKHRGFRYLKYGGKAIDLSVKALTTAMAVKRLLNVEFKNVDFIQTSQTVTTIPAIQSVSLIAQDDTTNTRDGAQVKATSLQIKYILSMDGDARVSTVRIMLIKDKQVNGAFHVAADVLDDVSTVDILVSPYELANKYRFTILYDKVHQMSITGNQQAQGSFYTKLDQVLRYDGAAADISTVQSCGYTLMFFSNELAANAPLLTSRVRLRYVDN